MVLEKLFNRLGVEDKFDKTVLAALVYETLNSNVGCGLTYENEEAVKEKLIDGVCSKYEFEVMLLAADWSNDLTDLWMEHMGLVGDLYEDHIWNFLTENEVYPGVRLNW